jgi:hypothetical protein
MNHAYPQFQQRTKPLGLREAIGLMCSPKMAGTLQLLVSVLRAQRGTAEQAAAALPRTPGR